MRILVCLVLTVLTMLAATPGYAQPAPAPEPVDVAALAEALRADPVQVLPGAMAKVDTDRLESEVDATEPTDRDGNEKSAVYVVLAPAASTLSFDELGAELGQDAEVIIVRGLRVELRSWDAYVRGRFAWGADGLLARQVNNRAEQTVLATYDVTGPVIETLLAMRNDRWPDYPDRPESGSLDQSTEDAMIAALRRDRVYVDPDVAASGAQRWDPFEGRPPQGPVGYRIAYLPAVDEVPVVRYMLAKEFPDDVVVVVNGHWVAAQGPGSSPDIGSAEVRARGAVAPSKRMDEPYPPASHAVATFFDRLTELRGGTLSPPSAVGGLVGSWGFAAAGAGIAVLSIMTAWLARRRRTAIAEKAFRTGMATAVGDLARLAAIVERDGGPNARRRAEAAERYATARDLVEQAGTPGELDAAREVIVDGLTLAGEPAPTGQQAARTPPRAARTPRQRSARQERWLLSVGAVNALLAFLPHRDKKLFDQDFEATTLAAWGTAILAVSMGVYLLVRDGATEPTGHGGALSRKVMHGWSLGLVIACSLPVMVVLDLDEGLGETLPVLIIGGLVGLFFLLRNRVAGRLREPTVHRWDRGLTWVGLVTALYAVVGFYAEGAGQAQFFRATVVAGYGAAGVFLACGLFVLVLEQRSGLESRRERRRALAGARATAFADLLRMATTVSATPTDDPETAGRHAERYAEAMAAFERASTAADFTAVSTITRPSTVEQIDSERA
ncbi:hypothetical protein [Actinophytocola sp.]|uniref:hypothetical protein n=1 Tax=Actinophytocola sp. TaxID=1872138 RepID=UPI003D6B7E45